MKELSDNQMLASLTAKFKTDAQKLHGLGMTIISYGGEIPLPLEWFGETPQLGKKILPTKTPKKSGYVKVADRKGAKKPKKATQRGGWHATDVAALAVIKEKLIAFIQEMLAATPYARYSKAEIYRAVVAGQIFPKNYLTTTGRSRVNLTLHKMIKDNIVANDDDGYYIAPTAEGQQNEPEEAL